MYGTYHGPEGLKNIANRVHSYTVALADAIVAGTGHSLVFEDFFDTIAVKLEGTTADAVIAAALAQGINLRKVDETTVGISLDETVCASDLAELIELFTGQTPTLDGTGEAPSRIAASDYARTSSFMQQQVWSMYHSETDMMR